MRNVVAAVMLGSVLVTGCATPVPGTTATPTLQQVAFEPTATAPPTNTPVPSPTPTVGPADEGCLRARAEIPEGQNPTVFLTSGPASGCYDSVGEFLDDIGLTWGEFAPGTVITIWTRSPVDSEGMVVPPTPTPVPLSVTISPSKEDGFEYVCGHPPFTVDFSARVTGGSGDLECAWDFDTDGRVDSRDQDPGPFTYGAPGVYNATLTVTDEAGQSSITERRIVAIGEPTWPSWKYGVMAHVQLTGQLYADYAQSERAVRMVEEAGIEAIRLDLAWPVVEPNRKGEYDWRDYDRVVRMIRDHGIQILALVNYSARWASSGHMDDWNDWGLSAPRNPRDFADFAKAIVDRYPNDIHAWQIWGETNCSLYFRGTNAATYTEMLKQAYLAIKYSDPTAVVVLSGLASDASEWYPGVTFVEPTVFLQTIYDNGGRDYFDAVARHPYADPSPEGLDYVMGQLDSLRRVMVANEDAHKRIWITECGWSSSPPYSEERQAQWATAILPSLIGLDYVGPLFWYNLRDKGTDPNNFDDNLGLIRIDFTPKPAYYAYQEFIRQHPSP